MGSSVNEDGSGKELDEAARLWQNMINIDS